MIVRFYLSGSEPVERVLPLIAAKAKGAGERMLVISDDAGQIDRLDRSLWEEQGECFLAHGRAGEPHASRQPILLSADCQAPNGASVVIFADGVWRDEGEAFERAFVMFDDAGRGPAREAWARFNDRTDLTREYWALEQGSWRKKQ